MPEQLYNKISYFNKTLIDLTEDTVTPETLRSGVTAHDASGAPIVGTRNNDTISFHDNDMIVEPGTNRITFDGSDMIIHPPDGAAWLERTMEALEGGVAIISTNNEHAAISNGQYVYIRMHETLPDGLYKATIDITQNAELSSLNVTSTSGALNDKSDVGHTHDDRYYTESEVDTALDGKANSSHTHDDRYYTESEVDTALNGKANSSHTHDDRYYTETEIDTELSGKVSKTGDTMTGALNFVNSTWNKMGDDCYIGDCNAAGCIGIKGINGVTGINFVQYATTASGTIKWDGTNFISSHALLMNGRLKFPTSNINAIDYQGTNNSYTMIRFIDNTIDGSGNGISIGGGGLTIIGGGESASNAQGAFSSGGSENLVLCNDGAIDIWTNCQNGHASATKRTIDTNGNFNGNAANVTGTVAIDHGGTGATTAANARKNLFNENLATDGTYLMAITQSWARGGYISKESALSWIGAAASSHNHSADNITSGTLPIGRGGTGQSSVTTGTVTLNTTNCTSGVISYRKWGPIVQVYTTTAVRLKTEMAASTVNVNIGSIGTGFRPVSNGYHGVAGNDGNNRAIGTVWIDTSGNVIFCKHDSTRSYPTNLNIHISAMYFTS